MHPRATLATWVTITALVVVVFCTAALPDSAGWAAGYLGRWEIAFPVAVLAPMLISLIWMTIKASGKIEYLGMEFYDPLAWLRIGVWLDQVFLHPWQWATSSLHPIPEPPTKELHRFQIGLTPWVIYADAWPSDKDRKFIHWVLARQPVNDEQFFVIAVAKGKIDARLGHQPVIDLATQRAQRSTYTAFGAWAFVLFALTRLGSGYHTIVGFLWILAVSALLHLWFHTILLWQQGHNRRQNPGG